MMGLETWLIWSIAGIVMMLLEFLIPGAVIVFLGVAALIVSLFIYSGWITTIVMALIAWFIISIFLMIFLRSVFVKYFEGESLVQNVDEDTDLIGSIVVISEEVLPYKEGRVRFRDTTWVARSEEELKVGNKAIISGRDGNKLIIKSI